MTYPRTPGFKERGSTSEDTAHSMECTVESMRAKVYKILKSRPRTADEVAKELGESVLSVRPRLSELRNLGLINPTGERRSNQSGKSAKVWQT